MLRLDRLVDARRAVTAPDPCMLRCSRLDAEQRLRDEGLVPVFHQVDPDITCRVVPAISDGGLDTVFDKVAELNRQLEATRAELEGEQRRYRRPPVTSVKKQEVVMALAQLQEVLPSDVGRAAPMLHALVADVVIEPRKVAGQKRSKMVAKFTINGIPPLPCSSEARAGTFFKHRRKTVAELPLTQLS